MKLKRILCTVLAAVLLCGVLPLTALASQWGEGDTLENALAQFKVGFADTQLDWLSLPSLGVIKQRYTYFLFKNTRTGTIDEHPVYCIDPTKGGAHEIVSNIGNNPDDGSRTATYIRAEKVGDLRYRAILESGYPHVRYAGLGLQSIEEAYYATKVALWMYIRGTNANNLTINPTYGNSHAVATRVRDAAIWIYERGMRITPSDSRLTLTGKPNTAHLDNNGEYYVQNIDVYASHWIGTNPDASGDVTLSWDSPPPTGTVVLGTNGEDITASMAVKIIANNGKVTIKYPAAMIDVDTFSPPTLIAKAIMPNNEIYIAYAEAGKDKYQRYLVEKDPKTTLSTAFISQLSWEPIPEEFTEDSGLRIRKVQAGTNIPLEGALFEIRDPQGRLIYSLTTDSQGIIDVPLFEEGNHTVTEVVPPLYHTLPSVRTQSVYAYEGETAEVTFVDEPYGALRVVKRDASDGRPLAGASIRIRNIVTNTTQEGVSDSSGSVYFDKLPCGAYEIKESTAPTGYALDTKVHTVNVVPLSEGETSYVLVNKANPGLRIVKFDRQSMTPIAGVTFEVWRDGELYGTFVTNAWGEIELLNLPAGTYLAREIAAPTPYVLDKTAQWIELKAGQGYIAELIFFNLTKPGIWLRKVDAESMNSLTGAKFRVQQVGGSFSQEYVTDANGEINLTGLEPGAYTVTELTAPNGYLIDDAQRVIQINAGERAQFVFTNTRKPSLIVKKYDMETAQPLPDTEFSIAKKGGTIVYEGLTNGNGFIRLDGLDEGWYTVSEMAPPPGYLLSYAVSKDVYLVPGNVTEIKFDNVRCPTLTIEKRDSVTGDLIPNVKFNVKFSPAVNFTGGVVDLGIYMTDSNGSIILDNNLQSGWYRLTEIEPAPGYTMKEPVTQDIYLKGGDNKTIYFENIPKSALVILKIDSATGLPVAGATFEVRYLAGFSGSGGTLIKTAVTSLNGTVVLTGLNPGTYVVQEVRAAPGYELANPATQTAYISGKEQDVIELVFTNPKMGRLVITKLDSVTRQPVAGVTFLVTDSSGAVIGPNNGEYTTDLSGVIEITEYLPIGSTVNVKEIRVPGSYIMDAAPQSIKIMENTTHRLTFYNSPKSGLQIKKIDSATRQPIANVEFSIVKMNGERIGAYKTDTSGLIYVTLEPGWYTVVETKTASNYILNSTPRNVEVKTGAPVVLEIENTPKTGLRVVKIDSLTKKPIFGVEFMLFDSGNRVVGVYYTDNNGVIDFSGDIPEGRYTIRETRPAANYYNDDMPRTVEFKAGQVTEIRWENVPKMGQIQVLKKSGDDNEVNGLPAGTPLAGAIFEICEYKSGKMVDRMISGNDGRAVSKPLPLGRYIVKEVQAPQWYKLSTQTLDIDVEFATQIVKMEYLNYSANTGVYIKKTGPAECLPGNTIRYDVKAVQNTSTVPLTDFYWRDTLPTNAVRLTKIVTGTYNQSLKYKIMITTNKGDTRLIADNLSTTRNNVIDCSNASLGLRSDEYVTSFSLLFGTVKAGFAQVIQPQVFVKVLSTLPNGFQFANKADVGGKYGREWVVSNSTTLCKTYKRAQPLPRTGF